MQVIYTQKIIKRLMYITLTVLAITVVFNMNHLKVYAATGDTFTDTKGIVYEITAEATADSNGTVKIVENRDVEYTGNILIPDIVTDGSYNYKVTAIEDQSFYDCNITGITIPKCVVSIGEKAFVGCESLMAVTVDSDNLVYVSDDGILYNKNKTTLLICPSGRSKDVVIPTSVTVIGDSAFLYCRNLSHIIINGNSLISIGNCAFVGCNSLVDLILPESLTTIGDSPFYECNSLTSMTIPKNVASIKGNIFWGCEKLTEINVADDHPTFLSEDGILYDKNRTKLIICPAGKMGTVMIPNGVNRIGSQSFTGCNKITNVILPDSVISIGSGAFSYCSKLNSIALSKNLTTIDGSAFFACTELSSISIPNGLKTIGMYTFARCSKLTSIKLPNSIKIIGECSFGQCSSLSSITIPKNVTFIGDSAFQNCKNLTSVTLNKKLKEIGHSAFYGCSLSRITIPESVKVIGVFVFEQNHSDSFHITFQGKKPPSIFEYSLYDSNLTSITVPYSARSQYKSLFKRLGISVKIQTSGKS